MSAVGLTKAMRAALELIRDRQFCGNKAFNKAMHAGLVWVDIEQNDCGLSPRGHAALAAPRMTQAEYEVMCAMDQAKRQRAALWTHDGQWSRRHRLCYRKGWAVAGELTPSGLKALNDIRAATGSELYKDNMP